MTTITKRKQSVAEIIIADARWRKSYAGLRADVQKALALVLQHQKMPQASLNVLFSNDSELQQLNRDYRGKNKPTNVLSFPSGELEFLGDIALSYDTVLREKTQQGKSWRAHTLHLVIHGTLHLLGHDHEEDDAAEVMEAIEIKILAQLAIANPYH